MKTKTFTVSIMMLALALTTIGCMRTIVRDISPRVISSDIDVAVERNKSNKEKYITAIEAERLKRSRAAERQIVAIAEIRGKLPTNEAASEQKKLLTADGIIGGFPTIIINDSACNASGKITQLGGFYSGTSWSFDLKANGGIKEFTLESEDFMVRWSYPPSAIIYPLPGKGDIIMSVHNTVQYLDDRTKKGYHGAYRIKGKDCH